MKTTISILAIALIFCLPVLAEYTAKQLTEDIDTVAHVVAAKERGYVTNYLRTGPSGLRGSDFLTATMARNALNKIQLNQNLVAPLTRIMFRHAQSTNFPTDTRQYGFAKLTHMAGRDPEAKALTRSLNEEIIKRDQDPLVRAAERFLSENGQPRPQSAPGLTPNQLVGQWRRVNVPLKLVTTLTFKADGTYTGNVQANGKANGSFSGKWTLADGKLNYEYTASSDKNIPAGSKDQDKIIEITKTTTPLKTCKGAAKHTYASSDMIRSKPDFYEIRKSTSTLDLSLVLLSLSGVEARDSNAL